MSPGVDVVGVFDSGLNQLFVDARAMKASVKEDSKLMEHPAETGITNTDHIVFLATEIELSLILRPKTVADTYQQIKTLWLSATTVSVQTNVDTYTSMMIMGLPHEEDPEMYDTISLALKLRMVRFVTAQYAQLPVGKVVKPRNSSTTNTGTQTPTPATPTQTSTAYSLFFGN